MTIVSTRARARKSVLLYGYRITGLWVGLTPFSLPTIFSADVPAAWYDLKANETVISATLRRRGRVVGQFRREAVVK